MMVEWLRKKKKPSNDFNPKDKFRYVVATEIIQFTETLLQQYGQLKPAAEGLVYWAGIIRKNTYFINAAIAPQTSASRYGIFTTHSANAHFVDFVSDHDLVYIAQVHSHPSAWVDHSETDNKETAFRAEGLVSIVVPDFSIHGMLPLIRCGIHRYSANQFKRLGNKYIENHFVFEKLNNVILKDLRYEK